MRVVIGEDSVLLRAGVARLLEDAGMEVVAQAADAEDLLRKVRAHKPDVAVVDIRMPPGNADDGLRAAQEMRGELPDTGVLVLSQYAEEHYVTQLLQDGRSTAAAAAHEHRNPRRRRIERRGDAAGQNRTRGQHSPSSCIGIRRFSRAAVAIASG